MNIYLLSLLIYYSTPEQRIIIININYLEFEGYGVWKLPPFLGIRIIFH